MKRRIMERIEAARCLPRPERPIRQWQSARKPRELNVWSVGDRVLIPHVDDVPGTVFAHPGPNGGTLVRYDDGLVAEAHPNDLERWRSGAEHR